MAKGIHDALSLAGCMAAWIALLLAMVPCALMVHGVATRSVGWRREGWEVSEGMMVSHAIPAGVALIAALLCWWLESQAMAAPALAFDVAVGLACWAFARRSIMERAAMWAGVEERPGRFELL